MTTILSAGFNVVGGALASQKTRTLKAAYKFNGGFVSFAQNPLLIAGVPGAIAVIDWLRLTVPYGVTSAGQICTFFHGWGTATQQFDTCYIPAATPAGAAGNLYDSGIIHFPGGLSPDTYLAATVEGQGWSLWCAQALTGGNPAIIYGYHYDKMS